MKIMQLAIWIAVLAAAASVAAAQQSSYPPPAGLPGTSAQTPGQAPAPPSPDNTVPGTPPQPSPGPGDDPRVDQPLQPLSVPQPLTQDNAPPPVTTPLLPDTTPLNSPQGLTLGSSVARSDFNPTFRFTEYTDHSSGTTQPASTLPVMNLVGGAELTHSWIRSSVHLTFNAGGDIFPTQSESNGTFQTWSLDWMYRPGRWVITLNDSGSYTPESSFGYFGLNGVGSGGSLGNGYIPNQSILFLDSPRIANSVGLTARRSLSARSNIHVSSTFSIFRFQGGGFTNSNDYTYNAGYDHTIGAHDTLGVAYEGTTYTYNTTGAKILTHTIALAYGRRLTGRMALQLSGGPSIRVMDDPVLGSGNTATYRVRADLTYRLRTLGLSTSFTHYTSAGGGLNSGTDTYLWDSSVTQQLGRVWSASFGGGYAHNSYLGTTPTAFNTEYASVQISRPLGRTSSIFFSYNLQHQAGTNSLCVGCEETFLRNVVGFGFQWSRRPAAMASRRY